MSTQTLEPAAPAQTDLHVAVDAEELPASSELSRFRAAVRQGKVPDLSVPAPKVEPPPAAPAPAAKADDDQSGPWWKHEIDPTTGNPFSSRQQYINSLVAARTRSDMRVEQLERDLEVARGSTRTAPAEPDHTRPMPAEDQVGTTYTTYGDYVRDLARWELEQHEAVRNREAQSRATQQLETDSITAYQKTVEAARVLYPDFEEVISRPLPALLTPTLRDAIRASAIGGQLAYHMSLHPDVYQRIRALPIGKALMAMGALEAQLQATTQASLAPAAPLTTSAPPPPLPQTVGSGVATGTPDISKVNDLWTFRTVIKPKFGMF